MSLSISIDSVVAMISSAAPLTFFVALAAGIFGNIVSGYLFRKRFYEHYVELNDLVVKFEATKTDSLRVKVNDAELKRLLLLVETMEVAKHGTTETKSPNPTDVAAKIGEYLSNRGPMDSLLKEVAK